MDLDLEGLGLNLRELDLAGELFDYGVGGSKNKDGGSMPAWNPLHLALAVSPLYLLMPIQLSKLTVGRKKLLNVSPFSRSNS